MSVLMYIQGNAVNERSVNVHLYVVLALLAILQNATFLDIEQRKREKKV
jgi:hypothetical protein